MSNALAYAAANNSHSTKRSLGVKSRNTACATKTGHTVDSTSPAVNRALDPTSGLFHSTMNHDKDAGKRQVANGRRAGFATHTLATTINDQPAANSDVAAQAESLAIENPGDRRTTAKDSTAITLPMTTIVSRTAVIIPRRATPPW